MSRLQKHWRSELVIVSCCKLTFVLFVPEMRPQSIQCICTKLNKNQLNSVSLNIILIEIVSYVVENMQRVFDSNKMNSFFDVKKKIRFEGEIVSFRIFRLVDFIRMKFKRNFMWFLLLTRQFYEYPYYCPK